MRSLLLLLLLSVLIACALCKANLHETSNSWAVLAIYEKGCTGKPSWYNTVVLNTCISLFPGSVTQRLTCNSTHITNMMYNQTNCTGPAVSAYTPLGCEKGESISFSCVDYDPVKIVPPGSVVQTFHVPTPAPCKGIVQSTFMFVGGTCVSGYKYTCNATNWQEQRYNNNLCSRPVGTAQVHRIGACEGEHDYVTSCTN